MVVGEISRWFQGRFDDSKVFRHRYVSGSPGRIILTPIEGISKFISQIEIFLGSRPGIIEKVEIVEPGGSRTSTEFRKMEINSNISSEIFERP